MNFIKELRRIRRFLRDPGANIWDRALLLNLYNDAQRDVQIKTGYLEDAVAIRVPPLYHCSYLYDWEWSALPNGSQYYKALKDFQQGDYKVCYQWEAQFNNQEDASDEGAHFTHPWEAFAGYVPGDQVKIKFPSNFHKAKGFYYDREPIVGVSKKDLQTKDSGYLTRTGRTFAYYREDDLDNSFIPYPVPSSVDWNDIVEEPASYDYIYTYSWEDGLLEGTGGKFTDYDSDTTTDYIYSWEFGATGQDEPYHGMWLFEGLSGVSGQVIYKSTESETPGFGAISYITGSLNSQESGVAVDVIEVDDNFFLIYEVMPTDLVSDDDVSDFPRFLRKYVEYHVLSRAYRANTDGNIKSLAEYWDYRYQVGLQAIKRYINLSKNDRDFRLALKHTPNKRYRQLPRLPSTYPAI